MSSSVVLCLSGGLDSSTLLYELRSQGYVVEGVAFGYGQRHSRELDAAQAVAKRAGVSCRVVDLSLLKGLLSGSALTDGSIAVPHGHYSDESMKLTVVPNRNMIFLSVAAGYAMSLGASAVAFAAHGDDRAIYPDCRPQFVDALRKAIALAHWETIDLMAPYLGVSKSEICAKGAALGVPYELTWSCYEGGAKHCGGCGTCMARKEAFEIAGVQDPTEYL
jgi:7-cyano-7-deazaguanine synthase